MQRPMTEEPVIVFVCEHGAAKSIVAAAHFNWIAREKGIAARAIARGTHPEPALSDSAVTGLLADGLQPTEAGPRKLEPAEIAGARKVISFCELPREYEQEQRIEHWDDVPPISEGYEQARDAMLTHIRKLMISLWVNASVDHLQLVRLDVQL